MRWIPRREAIALVHAAQLPHAVGSRASARALLRGWTIGRGGKVRTKPGARGRGAKYPSRLYLRSDIERLIRRRGAEQHQWTAEEDAMLGTDYDTVIAARLDLAVKLVNVRRRELGIGIYRPPRSERRL